MEENKLVLFSIILLTLLHSFTSGYEVRTIDELQEVEKISLRSVVGPESLAFDQFGRGPYTGVSNGRILKWQGNHLGWALFAFNSNHRDKDCGMNNNYEEFESKCGRPLGLQFHKATGNLYVADAYLGLMEVGPNGGLMRILASSANGVPFNFTNGLDIDQQTGVVYFTDSSTKYQRRDYLFAVLSGDATGRLMKYDPRTKQVTVIKSGLPYPNGLSISEDNTYLLVAETSPCRIMKYWLRGPKTGTTEVFAELPGYPDNIKRNAKGEYWVALSQAKLQLNGVSKQEPGPAGVSGSPSDHPAGVRLSKEGKILEVLYGGVSTTISEVEERNGALWLGSVILPYVGVYRA